MGTSLLLQNSSGTLAAKRDFLDPWCYIAHVIPWRPTPVTIIYHLIRGRVVINIRRLAAVDIAFLGSRFILAEFSIGVVGSLCLGVLTLVRSHSYSGRVFGVYLVCIGVNYVPLLFHAISLVRHGTASHEIADEMPEKNRMFRKYRRQSLLLLVPLVLPILAIIRGWPSDRKGRD